MEDLEKEPHISPRRNKLGLALAGGGFRASLFHLGVLRRMAELDLLRSVEVLSTVSGGSIIGGLYMLLLKRSMDECGALERRQYIDIIDELDRILVAGIQKNLRTRLFMNPFGLLRVLVTSYSLGRRMARLYERYIYHEIADELEPKTWWQRLWRPGRIKLRNTLISPKSGRVEGGLERYNRAAVEENQSVITNLILNATSLNSGSLFRFSNIEIGDPRLGFFRYDELKKLEKCKRLLFSIKITTLKTHAAGLGGAGRVTIGGRNYQARTVSLAYWWKQNKIKKTGKPADPAGWEDLYGVQGFPGRILDSEFGLLRRIKVSAWYLRIGMKEMAPRVDGGLSPREHEDLVWEGLRKIYEHEAEDLEKTIRERQLFDLLLDFVLELYYLRSAEVMSGDIKKQWENFTLGDAVGASACFPPVFPPFIVFDFYDDWHVSRLGLTDGGVYDNVGIVTLLEERCNYIIASDTGAQLGSIRQSSAGRIGMSGRIVGILMAAVGQSQQEDLKQRKAASERIAKLCNRSAPPQGGINCDDVPGVSFFHINSPIVDGTGNALNSDCKLLASIRTDLDGFGDVEIAALVNHGYETADRYLQRDLAGSPYSVSEYWKAPLKTPKPIHRSRREIEHILKAGKSRFFRALLLGAPCTVAFSLAAFIAIVFATWKTEFSIKDLIDWTAQHSLEWINASASFLGRQWTSHPVSIGVVIFAAVIAAFVLLAIKTKMAGRIERMKNTYLPLYSTASTIYKWARSFSQNIIWVFRYWPVVITFGLSAVAWISHLFFYKPFKNKTRNGTAVGQNAAPKN